VYTEIMLMLLFLAYLNLSVEIIVVSYNSPFQTNFLENLANFEFQKQ